MPASHVLELIRARATRSFPRYQYVFHTISDPGRMCSEAERCELKELLIEATTGIFGFDTRPYWTRRGDYLEFLDELMFAEREGHLAGWCGACLWRTSAGQVIYIDTLMSLPDMQSRGLGGNLSAEMWKCLSLRARRPLPVVCRTQNPVVYRVFEVLSGRATYPKILGAEPEVSPPEIVAIARHVATQTNPGSEFDAQSFVVRGDGSAGAYGVPLGRPFKDLELASFFAEHVRVERGDAMIVVFYPDPWEVLRSVVCYGLLRLSIFLGSSWSPVGVLTSQSGRRTKGGST